MVSYWVAGALVAGTLVTVLAFGLAIVAVFWTVRKGSPRGLGLDKPVSPLSAPSGVDVHVLQGLSERIAILEGKYGALQPVIDGYATVSTRMANLEALLPNVADAYDKFQQTTINAEKRRQVRETREEKKGDDFETVDAAYAAQKMGLAGGAQVELPTEPQAQGRAGVYGKGKNSGKS